jgi:hypothetical protein
MTGGQARKESVRERVMSTKPTAADGIRGYLQQLTPQTRTRLLAEIERLRQNGDEIPGAELIIEALRSEPAKEPLKEAKSSTPLDPAARYFFRPLEPFLVDHPSERAHGGEISRAALPAIWMWLGRDLMASMTRDFTSEVRQHVSAGKERVAEQVTIVFQNKAVKYLEGTLAAGRGAEQARAKLTGYSGSPDTIDDLSKILCVLKSGVPLAQFGEALPARINNLDGEPLNKILKALDAFAAKQGSAVPFALALVAKRLATPWQLMRLATKETESKEAVDIAATPYAMAVTMILHVIDDKVDALRTELRNERIVNAKKILIEIYDMEYAMQVRIDGLEESPWGKRLATIMTRAAQVLETELRNLPPGLNHVLGSRALRRHDSLLGQLTYLGWKCRDMATDSLLYAWHLVAGQPKLGSK